MENLTTKKIIFILNLIFILSVSAYPVEKLDDDKIVEKIHKILITEYDKYEDKTPMEKFVLKIGRRAFVDSVITWKLNYKQIDDLKIILHPKLEKMAKAGDEKLTKKKAEHFRSLLVQLTRLGYKNLQIYYLAVKEYLEKNELTDDDITNEIIEESICTQKYYDMKTGLYLKEEVIKQEIRTIIRGDELKQKLAFYAFAFDFFNKIRKKIIQKEMTKMREKL